MQNHACTEHKKKTLLINLVMWLTTCCNLVQHVVSHKNIIIHSTKDQPLFSERYISRQSYARISGTLAPLLL